MFKEQFKKNISLFIKNTNMIFQLRNKMRKYIPKKIKKKLRSIIITFLRAKALASNVLIKKNIVKKEKINVLFFVIHHSVWKLDSVYEKFKLDSKFNPIIVLCPYTLYGDESMIDTMEAGYEYFKKKRFNVIKTFNDNSWVDINEKYKNKIIFFTNPHKLTKKEYQWNNFKRNLKFYVPYHHQIDSGQWDSQWKSEFHLAMTSLFYVDNFHMELSQKITMNKGKNVEVTGYPSTETLYLNSYTPIDVWKPQKTKKIRIIFAPHHTIEYCENLGVNEFLNVAEDILKIAEKYKDHIQMAFKPHPILKDKLIQHTNWGKEKVNEYYALWENGVNTQLEQGEYNDLFLTSDAMIHDSGSFLAEYLYVNKPVMYLYNKTTESRFNDYGLECLKCCYIDKNNDIDNFIGLILSQIDHEKKVREDFVFNRLIPKTNILPSEKIYQSICDKIFNEY